MENYKKKYENALNAARKFKNDCPLFWDTKNNPFKGVFEELSESEDEKIGKQLLNWFKDCKWDAVDNGTLKRDDIIAWLEKQGKYKSSDEVLKIRQEVYQSGYNDGYKHGCEDTKKQVEQKPTDKVEPKFRVKYAGNEYNVFEVKDIGGVTFYGIEDEPNHIDYVLPENCEIISDYGYGVKEKGSPYPTKSAIFSKHNPAWSEEDEQMLQKAISAFKYACFDSSSMILWLKSIKERMKGE